ncbi:MAG TPA: discoidin domain-containing protein, partial [Nannocystaceae bacterium]|nr:discoidin domain-containing protein [Nannocystaceae bacterium]
MRILPAMACAIGTLASACSGAGLSASGDGFATLGEGSDGAPGAASDTGSADPGASADTASPGIDDDGGGPGTDAGGSTAGCEPTPAGPCTAQTMSAIAAIGDDGHAPANAFDGDLATRWSFAGVGAWISFDLGETRELCELRIAWYRGDERTSDFRVEASTDGTTWSSVYAGASSGTSADLESYALDGSAARWVRVVVSGNSDNDWASISEIETDARAPAVDDCDAGTGGDDTGDAGQYDDNGVLMLLPTDPGCFSWSLAGDPNVDPSFRIDGRDGFAAEPQADGSWYFEPREGGLASGGTQLTLRLHVTGTDADEDFDDHAQLRERGYMTSDPDGEIGNQEMTAYVRLA